MNLSVIQPGLVVIGVLLSAYVTVSDTTITCYKCSPCRTIDERSYGTCRGVTCLTIDSRTKGGHTSRGCLQYYRHEGCITKMVNGATVKQCYCSTDWCNYSDKDNQPSPKSNNYNGSSAVKLSIIYLSSLALAAIWTPRILSRRSRHWSI